jgi:hypothetical protein
MRLVHLSDTHLGHRRYDRLAANNIQQRQVDVCDTFARAVEQIIVLAPDIVVIAGDVFDSVRPTNYAIKRAFAIFSRIVAALPGTIIVLAAGNHDLPRSTDHGGSLLPMLDQLGIYVIEYEARRLTFRDRDLSILAVPDAPGKNRPALEPDPSARYNVLVIHGEVAGVIPNEVAIADRAAVEISAEEMNAPAWTYIAFGHYHVMRELAPNAFYSGAIDYTSTNVWGELAEEAERGIPGKGFIVRDLVTGAHAFHPIGGLRRHIDLPTIDAEGLTSEQLTAQIAATVDACPGGIDGAVVRLTISEAPRALYRDVDHRLVRSYRKRAMAFTITLRPAKVRYSSLAQAFFAPGQVSPSGESTTVATRVARPLRQTMTEKAASHELPPDVDRTEFADRLMSYYDEADAKERGRDAVTSEPATVTELFTEPQARAS